MGDVRIRVAGGPTAILEIGGLRLVTDPTFDAPGTYPLGDGSVLTKTAPAAFGPAAIGPADAVLLSHDQHADNLDDSGRAYLRQVPRTITTSSAAARLAADLGDAVTGLAPWESVPVGDLVVTAVPARHGPAGCEPVMGEVTGFVLTGDGVPSVYLSGDNAWLGAVENVAARFGPVGIAILFAGAASAPARFDGALLTIDSAQAATAARLLGAGTVVPVHYNSWAHLHEGADSLRAAFDALGLGGRLVLLAPGEEAVI
ncbi:MAG TPA: MBL fold metallo-hydrolase [Streptosporangiaceae bacterium]|nr:MBL fold metallo-hydrolase [Streptosporangiaceae bacterium]